MQPGRLSGHTPASSSALALQRFSGMPGITVSAWRLLRHTRQARGVPPSMRRIILSGASSPIGGELLRLLAARGDAELLLLTHRQAIAGFECLNCDLLDPDAAVLRRIRSFKADTLLHLAWSPASAATHGDYMHFKCLAGSLQLADAFIESGGEQLLGCGTFAEYGVGPGAGLLLSENAPPAPLTLYARMRCALHEVLEEICRARGVAFAWARIFSSFGHENDRQRLSAQLLDTLTAGRCLTIRTAQLVRDYIYFKDIAAAILQLSVSCPDCGTVNICSGQPVSVGELALEFARALGREKLLVLEQQPTAQPAWIVGSPHKLQQLCGFQPAFTLSEAVADLLATQNGADLL